MHGEVRGCCGHGKGTGKIIIKPTKSPDRFEKFIIENENQIYTPS